jgi:sterol desaturase/sphingolipid hydroxylase (fatty acid hydroxylase superfamily)
VLEFPRRPMRPGDRPLVKSIITIAIVLVVLAAIYAVLQRFWPAIRGQKLYRPGFFTDLGYWFLSPLINRGFSQIVVIAALIPFALALGVPMQQLAEGWGPVGAQPLWLQAIGIILIGDFVGYWVHRYTHQGWWWRVHAVHHSSPQLDWLAAARVHPFNDALGAVTRVVPLIAMGFAPIAVAGVLPFFTLFAITLHANLNWDYGPLRAVIASPRFHRWHHTSAEEGRDKNFSGLLPIWDILFGTYYMPKGVEPQAFGVSDPVPAGIVGQMAYPFRRSPAA